MKTLCKYGIIVIGEIPKFVAYSQGGYVEMTTYVQTNKKRFRVIVASIVLVVTFMLAGWLPAFQTATTVVKDNQLLVERTNMNNTSVLMDVLEIDPKGNVEEHEVRVNYEDGEEYFIFDSEYFQQRLGTENQVVIKGTSEKSFISISYYTVPVGATVLIVACLMMSSAFYLIFKLFRIW